MTYHVHAIEQDIAGKWYARVCLTEEEAVFLKFQEYPSMGDIQNAADAFVAARTPAVNEELVEVTVDATT